MNPLGKVDTHEGRTDSARQQRIRELYWLQSRKHGPNKKFKSLVPTAQSHLDESHTDEIASSFALTQWYAPIWRLMRNWKPKTVKRMMRLVHFYMALCLAGMLLAVLYVYNEEFRNYMAMESDEQRDYKRVIHNAKISEVWRVGEAALDKHDPLRALPRKMKMTIVVKALRDEGLVDRDYDLYYRNNTSALQDFDLMHVFYWISQYVGRVLYMGMRCPYEL
jgi:hypothetical protein